MKFLTSLFTLLLCLVAMPGFSLDLATTANNGQAHQWTVPSGQTEAKSDHKLSFKEKIALKLVNKKIQKMQKKMAGSAAPSIDKGVYIIVAIFIPFLAVGLATNFEGSDWLICLLLSFLFYLPGLIYALIKMKDYYG